MSAYLDYNATTPLDPAVREVMAAAWSEAWGSPSSPHQWGRRARTAVEEARERVAALVGCDPRQVTFTGGATEANNTVLKGRAARDGTGTILVGATEHPSVAETARYLARQGHAVAEVPVDAGGRVTPAALAAALEANHPVALVSVMWSNNETGTVQPVAELAAVCADHGVPLHTDAAQAAGKLAVDFAGSGAAALTLSAHKFHGPQGVGALVRDPERLPVDPLLFGGHHERDRRPGTENVAGIVGLGKAAELAAARRAEHAAHTAALRDRLEAAVAGADIGAEVVAADTERLPNTACLLFAGISAETLLMSLDLAGLAVSSGSACASGSLEPSPVLQAMGIPAERARSALRVSLGGPTTEAELEAFLETLVPEVRRLRQRAALVE